MEKQIDTKSMNVVSEQNTDRGTWLSPAALTLQ